MGKGIGGTAEEVETPREMAIISVFGKDKVQLRYSADGNRKKFIFWSFL